MGTKTFTQLKAGLVQRLQNRTDISDSVQGQCVNDAYDHVTRPNIYDHRELQASQDITLTATNTYALNAAVDVIRNVYNVTKGQRLEPRDIEQFDERVPKTARPSEWSTYASNLVLDSTPDGNSVGNTIRIRYWKFVTPLTGSATTVVDARWDSIIEVGASFYCWDILGNVERMAEARDNFARLIREVPQRSHITGKGRGFKAYPRITEYQKT
jgi:hypothetical protein